MKESELQKVWESLTVEDKDLLFRKWMLSEAGRKGSTKHKEKRGGAESFRKFMQKIGQRGGIMKGLNAKEQQKLN